MNWRRSGVREFGKIIKAFKERRGSIIVGIGLIALTIINAQAYDDGPTRGRPFAIGSAVFTVVIGALLLVRVVWDFASFTMKIRLITYSAAIQQVATSSKECNDIYTQSMDMVASATPQDRENTILRRTDEILKFYRPEIFLTVFRRAVSLVVGLVTIAVILSLLEANLGYLAQQPIFQGLDPQASFWQQLFVVFMSLVSLAGFGSYLPMDTYGYLLLSAETLVGIIFFLIAINIMLTTIITEVENTRETIRTWLAAQINPPPPPTPQATPTQ